MTKTTVVISYIILVAIIVYLAHWDWCVIGARLREGPRGWLAKLRRYITATRFALGLLIVMGIAWCYPTDWPGGRYVEMFFCNFWAEALGITITVLVIDKLYQLRQEEQLKAQLIREMGGSDNGLVQRAVNELAAHNWLYDGSLRGANLKDANLRETYLKGADLREAFLMGADLRLAVLEGGDLIGAYLSGAKLDSTDLNGTKYNSKPYKDESGKMWKATIWPPGFDPVAAGAIDVSKAGE